MIDLLLRNISGLSSYLSFLYKSAIRFVTTRHCSENQNVNG